MQGIIVIELNHKKAPIEIREVISTNADQIQHDLERLKEELPEIFIISTCNRFSVYCYCESEIPILKIFQSYCNVLTSQHLTILYNEAAVHHFFSTTAGLESQTIGEHEILGQVRNTFAKSNDNKTTGPILNELVNKAIHAGKRVRTETLIGRYAVSYAAITCNRIKSVFNDVSSISVLVYGTGEMAEIILKMLNKLQVRSIFISSKDNLRASVIAHNYNASTLSYNEMFHKIPSIEVIIGATRSRNYILSKNDLNQIQNPNTKLIIDLAVPRNFDSDIKSIKHIELYDLDDLKQTASNAIEKRKNEIVLANAIVEEEVTNYEQWLRFRNYVPLIQELKKQLDSSKIKTLKKAFDRTPNLSKEQKVAMERAAKLLVKKTLSKSITYYRKVNDSLRSKYMLDNNPNYSTNVINNNFMKDIEIVIKKELNTVFI